jgi:hypothetical protein
MGLGVFYRRDGDCKPAASKEDAVRRVRVFLSGRLWQFVRQLKWLQICRSLSRLDEDIQMLISCRLWSVASPVDLASGCIHIGILVEPQRSQ